MNIGALLFKHQIQFAKVIHYQIFFQSYFLHIIFAILSYMEISTLLTPCLIQEPEWTESIW